MATESDYVVRNPKLVFGYLTDLVKKKCIISAHFGVNNASFLTTIVELDQKKNLLALDCGPSADLDKQLLESAKVLFRTEMDGIKVSFSGRGIQKVKIGNDWALSMPIPGSIFWMQRRHYYRVKMPLSHSNSYCQLTLKADDDSDQTVTFKIHDLSVAGFAFINTDPKWNEQLQPDREFSQCILHLHNGNQAMVAFSIKNNVSVRTSVTGTGSQQRVGCLLTYLPPSFDSNIQRYMQEIELQQKEIG